MFSEWKSDESSPRLGKGQKSIEGRRAFFSIDCRRELTPLRVRETGGRIARFNLSQERSRDAISSVFDCLSPYRAKGIKEWIPGASSRRDRTESTVTDRKLDSQANQTDLPQTVGQRIYFRRFIFGRKHQIRRSKKAANPSHLRDGKA